MYSLHSLIEGRGAVNRAEYFLAKSFALCLSILEEGLGERKPGLSRTKAEASSSTDGTN